MKIEELEKWIETDEGKKWLEEKKKPLIEKRDQLLDELVVYKKRLTDETEKGNALEGKITGYLVNLKNAHCKNIFDDVQTFKTKVLDDKDLRQFVLNKIEKIAEADGGLNPIIDDNGAFKLATADGKEFADYYKEWITTEGAKAFLANLNSGGGALGSPTGNVLNYRITKSELKHMTPQQVAEKLDDPTFRNNFANS